MNFNEGRELRLPSDGQLRPQVRLLLQRLVRFFGRVAAARS